MTTLLCRRCHKPVAKEADKALDGTYAVVWATDEGWICEVDGNEHEPDFATGKDSQ